MPLLGTLVRLAYFSLMLLFFYFVLLGISSKYAPELKEFLLSLDPLEFFSELAQREWFFYFVLGVVLSEIFHVLLDLLTSTLKRFKI